VLASFCSCIFSLYCRHITKSSVFFNTNYGELRACIGKRFELSCTYRSFCAKSNYILSQLEPEERSYILILYSRMLSLSTLFSLWQRHVTYRAVSTRTLCAFGRKSWFRLTTLECPFSLFHNYYCRSPIFRFFRAISFFTSVSLRRSTASVVSDFRFLTKVEINNYFFNCMVWLWIK